MKRVFWALVLGGLLLGGCASTFEFRREEIFEDSAKRYGRLIRWSDFEAAQAYLAPAESGGKVALPKNVHVAEYEVKQMAYESGRHKVVQIVEISYYQANDPRLRKLQDQQLWEFDSAKGSWLLKSGLPNF
jgi:hypothetical protein